jgi:hypothetical protein
VKNRCVVCIGVSHLDNAQFVTFYERLTYCRPTASTGRLR